ncbi:protein O-mannosyl-transferase TMTC1 [Aplysia californica]|uniref:Protein O-mannosyl-transferase TMTC1 n=1 Tax=Aplysia californica TaxID=6500 RepID=A0ABM1A9B8_APLCA|nr:protein O-mannosyl-transferase TMTC1 [Aplysia californica]
MKNAAVSLRRLKRYPEAEQLLKQALSVHGDSSDYYNQLGLLYAEMGQTLDSLFAFRRSLALAPNNTLTHLRYLKALSEARQHEEVSRGLRDLLQRASNDVDVLRFAFVHAQQRDDLDGALHYAQEAVAQAEFLRHPDLAAFYHDLANIYRQKQDMEKAMEIFLLSVEQDPSYSQAYINIGALHHLQQNFEEAERYYLKALSLEPDNELCAANLQKLRKVWKKSSDSLAKT